MRITFADLKVDRFQSMGIGSVSEIQIQIGIGIRIVGNMQLTSYIS